MRSAETFLRDVIDIPEAVHAGDFKVELTGGFTETDARVAEYVVTDQLRRAFGKALDSYGPLSAAELACRVSARVVRLR